MTPTAEQVRRAYSLVPPQYGLTVLDKTKGPGAWAAELSAFFVVSLGSMSRQDFIDKTAQCVGPLLLIPFVPGTPHIWFDFLDQIGTLGHEIQHKRQWDVSPPGFVASYLADSRARALFEVDAIKPAVLLRHLLHPWTISAEAIAAGKVARIASVYKCDDADQECARIALLPFVVSVLAGAETSRAYPQVGQIMAAMDAA
jgi:hypothetical protein